MKVISDAHTCKDGCKYVRKRLQVLVWRRQCTASFPANVCNLCLKRLQSLPQTFAVKRRLLWNPFPSCFSAEPKCAMERDVMSEP